MSLPRLHVLSCLLVQCLLVLLPAGPLLAQQQQPALIDTPQVAGLELPEAPSPVTAQAVSSQPQQTPPATQTQTPAPPPTAPPPEPGDKGDRVHYGDRQQRADQPPPPSYGHQPKRIMGWIPNYRAVSTGVIPPPPTLKEKFKIATENTFDYSAIIFNAVDVEIPYIEKSYPEFGNGWSGYGQYFYHGFLDKGIGNYMTDFVVPSLTHEDARYYSMGTGHWYVRALYSYTRVLITPNDAGHNTFNMSEIVGKGAAAGLGNLYYPSRYTSWTKTGQRWLVQVAIRDGGFNVFREFWPDIATHVLRQHPHQ